MFPPSDSHSLENSSDSYRPSADGSNSATSGAATVEDRRGDLIPYSGGMMASGGMPWSFGPMRPEILTATPTFSNLMHALRRRLWLGIFSGLVLGGALGFAAWHFLPTKYESSAALAIKITDPTVFAHADSSVDFATYKSNTASVLASALHPPQGCDDKTVADLPLVKEHGSPDAAAVAAWLG